MQNLRNKLIAGGAVLILAAIGSVMNSRQSTIQGAGGPTVTIDQAQLPLPVQGSLGVSGTVAATQAGAWNVGVTGNVNAKQSGTWNVGITGIPIVQDRDSQARNFYQNVLSHGPCTGTCSVAFPAVPGGKRLIVQQVSAGVTFSSAGAGAPAELELRAGGGFFQILPITPALANFGAQTQYLAHAGVLAAYDSGQNPSIDAFVPNASSYSVVASISGYMIDFP
jgi:hypothetical protein